MAVRCGAAGTGIWRSMCKHGMMASRGDCALCVNASRQEDLGAEGCDHEAEGVLAENYYSQIDQVDWSADDARQVLEHFDCAPWRQKERQLEEVELSERDKLLKKRAHMGRKRKHKPAVESELQKWRRRRQPRLTERDLETVTRMVK